MLLNDFTQLNRMGDTHFGIHKVLTENGFVSFLPKELISVVVSVSLINHFLFICTVFLLRLWSLFRFAYISPIWSVCDFFSLVPMSCVSWHFLLHLFEDPFFFQLFFHCYWLIFGKRLEISAVLCVNVRLLGHKLSICVRCIHLPFWRCFGVG